jgi:pimeloyl-ACP methyl ester carboxylesterase
MRLLVIGFLCVVGLFSAAVIFTMAETSRIERNFPPRGRFVPVTGGRLHVIDQGPTGQASGHTIVLLHGASGNSADMMLALGDRLASRHRVLAFDRPGHGWSDRPGGRRDASPARQAALIVEALDALGVRTAIFVGHSWAGSVVATLGVDHAERVSGLVLLAPATHPWPGGVTWYYTPAIAPVLGDLFIRALAAPLGRWSLDSALAGVFLPQVPPPDYAERANIPLVLRPAEFRANAEDVKDLIDFVTQQSPRYRAISAPTVIVTGDIDRTVSPTIHSAALVRQIKGSKLIVLPGIGHMVHYAAPDLIIGEIDRLAAATMAAVP